MKKPLFKILCYVLTGQHPVRSKASALTRWRESLLLAHWFDTFLPVEAARRRTCRLLLAASIALTAPLQAFAAPQPYHLGPGDKVRINVTEWSTSGGEVRTRLAGEFIVSPSGDLSLPLVGAIQAAGLAPKQLGQIVSEQLKAKGGLLNLPVTSVEIVQYRPLYVLGSVERPGEYPYRPGMLVVHAVALAGGLYRSADTGVLRLGLDAIASRGEVRSHEAALDELLIRRARLQAELEDRDIITYPPEIAQRTDAPSMSQFVRQEQALMKSRREAFQAELMARQQLSAAAEQEVNSLREQISGQEQRITELRREMGETRSLVARGLTPAPRQFTIESSIADSDYRRRDMQTQLLRARQDMLKAEQAVRALRMEARTNIITELDQTERRLRELETRLHTAQNVVGATEAVLSAQRWPPTNAPINPTYVILREGTGRISEFPASETEPVLPGDVVKVVLPTKLSDQGASAIRDDSRAGVDTSASGRTTQSATRPVR